MPTIKETSLPRSLLNHESLYSEVLFLSTAIGIVATLAAPWLELRGTYAAWHGQDNELRTRRYRALTADASGGKITIVG